MKHFTFSLIFAIVATLFVSSTAYGQITQVGTATSAVSAGGSITIAKPTGILVGDVMFASISENETSGGNDLGDGDGLTGWTLIDGASLGGFDPEFYGYVYYKVAVAGDLAATNYTFDLDGQAEGAVGAIVAFRGVDVAGGIFDVAPGDINNVNTDATLNATAVTTVSANAAVIMFGLTGGVPSFSNWSTASAGALVELFDASTTNSADNAVGAAWTTKATAGTTGAGSATLSASSPNGSLIIALKRFVDPVPTPNMWSTSGAGAIQKYTVNPITGAVTAGPANVGTPTVSTAALAKNPISGTDAAGHLYYLQNTTSNSGSVNLYSMHPTTGVSTSLGSFDINGGGDATDLSFVRLAFSPDGYGYILAGGGASTLYLARFIGNGSAATTVSAGTVITVSGGNANEFGNGDIAFAGNGTMYAVANVTDGSTYVYTLTPSSTVLNRRWTLVQPNNANFTGTVNGIAFTLSGSIHISTSAGLYFIDQTTANTGTGIVQCDLIQSVTGLTDLASQQFPTQTTLPVTLISFAGSYRNQVTNLNWVTENLQNFDRFEIERSSNGVSFTSIASKQTPSDVAAKTTYLHNDDLSAVSGSVFYYRLKMIDLDGKFKYSSVILVRKDQKSIVGLTLSPNPVISGSSATVRFDAAAKSIVDFKVVDLAGRVVLKQQNTVSEGTNSISITNLDRLQPGMYVLQMVDGVSVNVTKFTIAH